MESLPLLGQPLSLNLLFDRRRPPTIEDTFKSDLTAPAGIPIG
jgi:hypothetical protein